ncbi:MAG: response regulator transcription factor [Planctomyces sp.]|nr:response regulator transcription factor [Planctomyces sp.]
MSEIRVLIADDHAVLRSGLRLLINTQPDMKVVGEAGDFAETRQQIRSLAPDVVTLDLSMPGGDPVRVIEELTRELPTTRILILTMHDDASMFRAVFAAGAAGYIVKSSADTELLNAIRAVAVGRSFVSLPGNSVPSAVESSPVLEPFEQRALQSLSKRELEVLTLVAQGHTNQAIANRLYLSVKTVESYRSRLMTKLELRNRAELTQFAMKTGLLQMNPGEPNNGDPRVRQIE